MTISRTYAVLVLPIFSDCGTATWANGSRQITVLGVVDYGTVANGNETLCNPGDPSNITMSSLPSGGAGTFSYQWYYKNGVGGSCPSGSSTSGWTLIGGATSSSYDPPSGLTTSRTYALMVNPTGSPDCGGAMWADGCRKVTVLSAVNYGTVSSGDETQCNPADPSNITMSTLPTGGAGTFSYQWYYKDGVGGACPTGSSTSGWTLIGGATSSSYNPGSGLTTSRTYAVQVNPTGTPDCGGAVWANGCRKVTVYAVVNFGTVNNANQTLCSPANPANITFSSAPSGGAGTFSYQWYYKSGVGGSCPSGTSTSGWTLIGGATSSSYNPPGGLNSSRTYAVMVNPTGSPDCGGASWASGCRKITVNNCGGRVSDDITSNEDASFDKKSAMQVGAKNLDLIAYPNPTENFFNLKIASSDKTNVVEVKVYDMVGKLVQRKRGAVSEIYQLGHTLVAGVYVVEVLQGDQRAVTKVVKQ